MSANRDDQAERTDQIEDLATQPNVPDAEQVKGGFNPQPEPPKTAPVFRPPTKPGGFVR